MAGIKAPLASRLHLAVRRTSHRKFAATPRKPTASREGSPPRAVSVVGGPCDLVRSRYPPQKALTETVEGPARRVEKACEGDHTTVLPTTEPPSVELWGGNG